MKEEDDEAEEEAEEEEAAEPSVNEILLMEGLARMEKYAFKKPQCKPFVEAQESARKAGPNQYSYSSELTVHPSDLNLYPSGPNQYPSKPKVYPSNLNPFPPGPQ